jgi:hypothetical protein
MSRFTTSQKNLIKSTTLGLVKMTTLRLVLKTILVVLKLFKSTCPRKPEWFFDPLLVWGTFWFENPI